MHCRILALKSVAEVLGDSINGDPDYVRNKVTWGRVGDLGVCQTPTPEAVCKLMGCRYRMPRTPEWLERLGEYPVFKYREILTVTFCQKRVLLVHNILVRRIYCKDHFLYLW